MRAMLSTPAGLAGKVRDHLLRHRAGLRSRVYETAAFNAPSGPHEVVTVTAGDGVRLRAHVYGPANAHTIVLVHGWTCSLEYWYPQINAFAGEYRVVAYDVRGHGESERGASKLTTDLLADDLQAVLEATLRPEERAVLVGHSLGGMTMQAWAGRYPEQVPARAAAVLLTNTASANLINETTVVPPFGPEFTRRLPFLIGLLGLSAPLPLPAIGPIPWVLRRQIMSLAATGDIALFSHNIVRSCPASVRGRFGTLLSYLNVGEGARNLTVPTTVVAGEFDFMTPPVHSERIVEMLREAGSFDSYRILPTGHLGNVEAYEEFNVELARIVQAAFEIPAALRA
ncbi:alpha/beta fold hydrolase [Nocardia sp. NPDC050406]|uniref:alpha/beta fold hydrolase n=1 Tax=Nocardia sp. NPDC050406 TaxID=3364318 RepID=UPI0037A47E0C